MWVGVGLLLFLMYVDTTLEANSVKEGGYTRFCSAACGVYAGSAYLNFSAHHLCYAWILLELGSRQENQLHGKTERESNATYVFLRDTSS